MVLRAAGRKRWTLFLSNSIHHPYSTIFYISLYITTNVYFLSQQKYNTVIHNMQQPLLISRCRSRGDMKQVEEVHLVPELCRMTGMHDDMKDMFMMRAFAELTNFEPGKHIQKLTTFCQRIIDETPVSVYSTYYRSPAYREQSWL